MHLERLIAILEMIAVAGRPISAAEVQKATGLPKPTCYRLIQTLQEQRLIEDTDGSSRFVIGERLIRIALLGKSDVDVRRASAPLLKSAAIEIRETCFWHGFATARSKSSMLKFPTIQAGLYLSRPRCAPDARLFLLQSHCRFCRAGVPGGYLEGSAQAVHRAYQDHAGDALRAEFAGIVQRGFAECDQEIDVGVASVAAPITIGNIGATFSVGAVGPIRRFDAEYRAALGQRLKQLAERISGAIQLCSVADV
jgi:IclR family acetate operon transcriptional repressor